MKIDTFQHPDSIWTWSSNLRGSKTALWIPYLQSITKKKKGSYEIAYNVGTVIADLEKVDTVLIYGASGSLPVDFLDELATRKIALLIHRRNLPTPYVFIPTYTRDQNDVLTRQILTRENSTRRAYIARTLILERFAAASPELLAPVAVRNFKKIRGLTNLRLQEARWADRYWTDFFIHLSQPQWSRRSENPVSAALDACSFFLHGILLRWILLHRLSPTHGFLHESTEYPALVYDLMEPYRYLAERAVSSAFLAHAEADLTERSIGILKVLLEEVVYVPETRQWVSRKNLLHGIVLATMAYLSGKMKRFVVPKEGNKNAGGRPIKVSYTIPGSRKEKPPVKSSGGGSPTR